MERSEQMIKYFAVMIGWILGKITVLIVDQFRGKEE